MKKHEKNGLWNSYLYDGIPVQSHCTVSYFRSTNERVITLPIQSTGLKREEAVNVFKKKLVKNVKCIV